MNSKKDSTEYELYNGLFGQTDRNNGEYTFKSGNTQRIYSNASYIPVDESTDIPRYYRPSRDSGSRRKKTSRKERNGLVAIAVLCLLCALAGGTAGALLMNSINNKSASDAQLQFESAPVKTEENTIPVRSAVLDGSVSDSMDAKSIYNAGCKQVVSVNTEKYTPGKNGEMIPSNISGTGFFISEDGYILTNYHVVEQAYRYNYPVNVTTFDGDDISGTVVGFDDIKDLAVLKVNSYGCSPASLGDSGSIEVGDDIYIIGNPYGVLDFTFTTGRVGGPIRKVDSADNGIPVEMFQLDADIFEGNSGGPVFNDKCQVIGIVTAMYSQNSTEGIGFAIPINDAKDAVANIISNGYTGGRASLGVDYSDKFNSVMASFYNLPAGACIMNVRPGSCAEKAGFERGDIVVQIGNDSIYDKYDCEDIISLYKAGDTTSFVIYRESTHQYEYITVTFDEATA